MKKSIILLMFLCSLVHAQTFPVNNLTVSGTQNTIGVATFQTPIAVTSGGIGTGIAGGAALDNISGFSGTGFLTRTGANTYSFQSLTNGITLGNLSQQASNTVLANATGSTANITAFAMPSCSTSSSAVTWTTNTGFTCNTAINAATAITQAFNTNSTAIATTAYVKAQGFEYTPTAGLGISVNTTLTASQANSWAQIQSPNLTVTLPAIAGVPIGNTFTFLGGNSVGSTIKANASENISDVNGISSNTFLLPPGESVTLASNGTSWFASSVGKSRVLYGCQNIMDYNGDGSNTNDNSTAFTNAIAGSPTNNKCVYFPPGTYKFTSAFSYSLPASTASITILGAGSEVSILSFPTTGGITINYSRADHSAHIANLALLTGTTNAGNAISLVQTSAQANPANSAQSDIINVTARGSDGYAVTDYWSIGIIASSVSNVNLYGVNVIGASTPAGVGFQVNGVITANAVVQNITSCTFNYNNIGILYGNYTQGMTVHQVNSVGSNFGVQVTASASGLDQLTVTDSQFNNVSAAIQTNTAVPNTMISHNLFIVGGSSVGVSLAASGLFSIIGNTFNSGNSPVSPNGINISSMTNNWPGVITGNVIFGLAGTGIILTSTSHNVNVQSNAYGGNGTNISNSGGAACPPTTTANCIGTASTP